MTSQDGPNQLIREREEEHLLAKVRKSAERDATLLVEEFIEVGSFGRIHVKRQILELLQHEGGEESAVTVHKQPLSRHA